jgi:predicted dehydrogenase
MNRREFLSATVIAAGAVSRSWSANDKVNLAIVGVGSRGNNHLGDFNRRQDVNLAAVCDIDTGQTEGAVHRYHTARNTKPRAYQDLRKLYDDKSVDAVVICTPNHWHAPATIWACQAGKDVYVEKPVSYNPFEGERMIAAAAKYNRVVQGGMQRRSLAHKKRAIQLLREGYIGDLYMARGLCYKRRQSIGHQPDSPVPPGVEWDIFLGPAPFRPFNANRFRYNWHWFWDTGNGDIGNQGIHELDMARWGLNRSGNPKTVVATGGKYSYKDDQETPNVLATSYDYGDCLLTFEVRGLPTGPESEMELRGNNFIGNLFYGSKGYLVLEDSGFKTFLGDKREPGEGMQMIEAKQDENTAHVSNFLECIRSRQPDKLVANVREAAISADLVHMANISYRTGRKLVLEPGTSIRFLGDEDANRLRARHPYRAPFTVT